MGWKYARRKRPDVKTAAACAVPSTVTVFKHFHSYSLYSPPYRRTIYVPPIITI
jgi:hypothetical protein